MMPVPDLLAAIVAGTRRNVAARARTRTRADLERAAARRRPRGDAFRRALTDPSTPRIIAECKRRSPSRGVLRREYEPAEIAKQYVANGAAAVSVVTEPSFFDGDLEHLRGVRAAVSLPLLQKDFIVAEDQLLEARGSGADAVLLIAAILEGAALIDLLAAADALGLAALVEVHHEGELDRAASAGASIIGVNSRDLRTLIVDLEVPRRLIDRIPQEVVAVAESGLREQRDLQTLQALGYDAFLIGELFMAAPDPGRALADLRADGGTRL